MVPMMVAMKVDYLALARVEKRVAKTVGKMVEIRVGKKVA